MHFEKWFPLYHTTGISEQTCVQIQRVERLLLLTEPCAHACACLQHLSQSTLGSETLSPIPKMPQHGYARLLERCIGPVVCNQPQPEQRCITMGRKSLVIQWAGNLRCCILIEKSDHCLITVASRLGVFLPGLRFRAKKSLSRTPESGITSVWLALKQGNTDQGSDGSGGCKPETDFETAVNDGYRRFRRCVETIQN